MSRLQKIIAVSCVSLLFAVAVHAQGDTAVANAHYREAMAYAEKSKQSYTWALIAFGFVIMIQIVYFIMKRKNRQR